MEKLLEILTLQTIIQSIIVAFLQNIFVDIFKAGEYTHFKNTGVKTTKNTRIVNKLLLIVSACVVFVALYIGEILTLQETIITIFLSTIIAWIFYKVNIYTQIIELIIGLKNGILNLIKKKFGE